MNVIILFAKVGFAAAEKAMFFGKCIDYLESPRLFLGSSMYLFKDLENSLYLCLLTGILHSNTET